MNIQQSEAQASFIIKGSIFANHQQLDQATIILKKHNSKTIIGYAITKADGLFTIPIKVSSANPVADTFNLIVSHIGFLTQQKLVIKLPETELTATLKFDLAVKYKELDTVKVLSKAHGIKISNDTITFNAKQFQAIDRPKVEDLLKSINGFSIAPNGKIYFNGREIKKILIDNDDIAESNYTMLSKNLNANIVGQVQVLKNYNSNRVLKDFENTGDYAVNLSINDINKSKPAIGVSIGSDFSSKYDFSQDFISLKSKNKNIVLTKYNNVANAVMDDIAYYSTYAAIVPDVEYDLVKVGAIQKPQLTDKYLLNNNDFSLNHLSLIKIGTTLKVKSLLGFNTQNSIEFAQEQSHYKLVDTSWGVESDIARSARRKYFYLQTSLLRDNGTKNNTGVYNFNVKWNPSYYNYNNLSKSNYYDTTKQLLSNDLLSFNFNASETIKINSKNVAELLVTSVKSTMHQLLNNYTNRYDYYFAFTTGLNFLSQVTNFDIFNSAVKLAFVKAVHPTLSYKYGLQYVYESFISKNEINISNNDFLKSSSAIPFTKAAVFINKYHFYNELNGQFAKKAFFQINTKLGLDKYRLNTSTDNFKAVHDIKLSFNYKFTDLKMVGLSLNQKTNLPNAENYYPQMLLSDIGAVYNGSVSATIITNNNVGAHFVNTNLFRNLNMSITANYSNVKGDMLLNLLLRPMFTEYFLSQQSNSDNFYFTFNTDKYLYPIKTKIILNVTYQNSTNYNLINATVYELQSNFYATKLKLVTGLPFSLTLENQIGVNFFNNSLKTQYSQKNNTSSQYELSQKINYKLSDKFYANIFYANYLFENKLNNYQILDGYFSLKLLKTYSVSLTMHNILNQKFAFQNILSPFLVQQHRYKINERYFLFNINLHF